MIERGSLLGPSTYRINITLPYLADGNHTITVRGGEPYATNSQMSHYWSYKNTISFTIAPSHIAITYLSVKNQTYNSTNIISINYTTNKTAAWRGYILDGNEIVTFWENTTLPALQAGSHVLAVFTNDTEGEMCSQTVCFTTVDLLWWLPTTLMAVALIAVLVGGLVFVKRKRC